MRKHGDGMKKDESGRWCLEEECRKTLYSQLTDIYSYGMVLYEIFSGKTPYDYMDDEEVNNLN
jgi:serine/threonine protein kinase